MILRFGSSYRLKRDLRKRWKPLQKEVFFAEFQFLRCSDSGFTIVRGSRGGALDRQYGLDFARNRQMILVLHGLPNELMDSPPVLVSDIVMDTSSALHNEEGLPSLSRGRLAHRALCSKRFVFFVAHYGLVRSFDIHTSHC